MGGSRRKMFGFMRAKHRKMMGVRGLDKDQLALDDDDDEFDVDYAQDYYDDNTGNPNNGEPQIHSNPNVGGSSQDNGSYLSPDEEEDENQENTDPRNVGRQDKNNNHSQSNHSHPSLHLKPTAGTLGETFSSGGISHQDMIDYFEAGVSSGSNDVDNSEIYYDDQGNPINGDRHTQFLQREDEWGAGYSLDEQEDAGADDTCCSKTLNTNLEGINYLQEQPPAAHHQNANFVQYRPSRLVAPYQPETQSNIEEPPAYYDDDEGPHHQDYYDDDGPVGVDEYGQPYYNDDGRYHPSQEYYDDGNGGQLIVPHHGPDQGQPIMYDEHGQPYYTGDHDDAGMMYDANGQPYFDGVEEPPEDPYFEDGNTIANSTIATEDPFAMNNRRQAAGAVLAIMPSQKPYQKSQESSWDDDDDEETRDLTALDDHSSEDDSESDSGSDSGNGRSTGRSKRNKKGGGRHRRRGKPMKQLLKGMKHCSLKGTSMSYDDDDDDFDDDATGMESRRTDYSGSRQSHSSRNSGSRKSRRGKQLRNKRSSIDKLFNKASALGQELLEVAADELNELAPRKRKGKKKKNLRRRSRRDHSSDSDDDDDEDADPATRIVHSLRDMFSCGHPDDY